MKLNNFENNHWNEEKNIDVNEYFEEYKSEKIHKILQKFFIIKLKKNSLTFYQKINVNDFHDFNFRIFPYFYIFSYFFQNINIYELSQTYTKMNR